MDWDDDLNAQLAGGRELAPSLVGLDRAAAVERVAEAGYRPDVVPPGVAGVTADLQAHRIRLFVDEQDVVVRATAG